MRPNHRISPSPIIVDPLLLQPETLPSGNKRVQETYANKALAEEAHPQYQGRVQRKSTIKSIDYAMATIFIHTITSNKEGIKWKDQNNGNKSDGNQYINSLGKLSLGIRKLSIGGDGDLAG